MNEHPRGSDISDICAALPALHEPRFAPVLTIVVPTFNEATNVPLVIERVSLSLSGYSWELVFVDDNSPDATFAIARKLGRHDARVRCIRRVGRRGLAGAFIEGALSSQAQFVAVMDADLQHDENLLPQMLQLLAQHSADLVIGSRYTVGGDAGGLSATRRSISKFATDWARRITRTDVKDPMSGFFMLRRELIDQFAPTLSNEGFKILFDILVTVRGANLKIAELPYAFRTRKSGSSKFDLRNAVIPVRVRESARGAHTVSPLRVNSGLRRCALATSAQHLSADFRAQDADRCNGPIGDMRALSFLSWSLLG